ncbi:hypothetical protein [Sphingomonas sp.]|uniref:hypothetical protein n=1 Tax=Sphingomonas sp. TaxID=28214 RepID=UPI001B21B75B|nr:hypothetical protein [Sphingomonas sp.]MBO9714082.1 hypothetical protein [Sphingomonas sp.]
MWIQLGASFAAVLVMAGAAWALRLGGGGGIASEAEAIETADALLSGFEGRRAQLGSDGRAAVVTGADGSLALLKLHGARIAVRRLYPPFATQPTPEGLRVASGEARFGAVTLRGVEGLPASG